MTKQAFLIAITSYRIKRLHCLCSCWVLCSKCYWIQRPRPLGFPLLPNAPHSQASGLNTEDHPQAQSPHFPPVTHQRFPLHFWKQKPPQGSEVFLRNYKALNTWGLPWPLRVSEPGTAQISNPELSPWRCLLPVPGKLSNYNYIAKVCWALTLCQAVFEVLCKQPLI